MDKSGGVGGSGSVMDKENRKTKMKAWRIDCLRDNDRSNIKNLVKSLSKMRVDDQGRPTSSSLRSTLYARSDPHAQEHHP